MLCKTDEIIQVWIREAAEQRSYQRCPLFRPVTIRCDGLEGTELAAYCRDISPHGIGILSPVPLVTGNTVVTLPLIAGRHVNLNTNILWCKSCGHGWYTCGGQFTAGPARTTWVLAAILENGEMRSEQRHPFLRPVTIKTFGSDSTAIPAMSRDISAGGIGLVHKTWLEPQHVFLTIDQDIEINADIRWCAPCGNGCYISGGEYRRLALQEMPAFRP